MAAVSFLAWIWAGVVTVYADLRFSYYAHLELKMIEAEGSADEDVTKAANHYLCKRAVYMNKFEKGLR